MIFSFVFRNVGVIISCLCICDFLRFCGKNVCCTNISENGFANLLDVHSILVVIFKEFYI